MTAVKRDSRRYGLIAYDSKLEDFREEKKNQPEMASRRKSTLSPSPVVVQGTWCAKWPPPENPVGKQCPQVRSTFQGRQ